MISPGSLSRDLRTVVALRFRELQTVQELWSHFRLRYDVFTEEYTSELCVDGLDIDAYDFRSLFVGAWAIDGQGNQQLIGCCRMVLREERSPWYEEVLQLLAQARDPRLRTLLEARPGLPAEALFDFDPVYAAMAREGIAPGHVAEFSRTTCLKSHRGFNVGSGLVAAIFALARCYGVPGGIGVASPRVLEFYRRLGCRPLPVPPAWMSSRQSEVYLMQVPLYDLPGETGVATERFEREFRQGRGCTVARVVTPQGVGLA